jgi:uncharacterized protein (DUF488 family)
MTGRVFTIGHSTHPLEEFVALLEAHGVERLVDVRTVPKSRHNPWFAEEALRASLPAHGIDYRRIQALGGLRHARKDSPNGAWRNLSFRGYADHMQTPEFAAGLEELLALGAETTVAVMCAEAVPWRCHRSLIGDALLVRGVAVDDILSATSARPHTLTPFAVVTGTRITYPPPAEPT